LIFAIQRSKYNTMTKYISTLIIAVVTGFSAMAQEAVPSVKVQTLDGKSVDIKELLTAGKPVIINFWATWCGPCKSELTAINEVYADWVEETGVTLIAVSIDDSRTMSRVKPYVDTQAWEYEVVLDPNGDLKRAMNVGNPPFTYLVDGNGNIVYKHTGYAPGDEEELHKKLLELKQ
jgi:thiol-disulfide isomerase/thioredoxin